MASLERRGRNSDNGDKGTDGGREDGTHDECASRSTWNVRCSCVWCWFNSVKLGPFIRILRLSKYETEFDGKLGKTINKKKGGFLESEHRFCYGQLAQHDAKKLCIIGLTFQILSET